MKYTTFTLLLALQLHVNAQFSGSYYIDTAGIKRTAWIEFLDGEFDDNHDRRISVTESGKAARVVTPDAIREFTLRGARFLSVRYGEKRVFMRVVCDGKHIKRLVWERHKHFDEYVVDGVAVYHELDEPQNEWLAHVFAAYPLLSDMALNKGLNARGFEASLTFSEYEKWADADSAHKADTSMAIRGMIDANLVKLPSKYFWHEFWFLHATGIIGQALRKNKDPMPPFSVLPIYNPQRMANSDYALGYRLRILTRVEKLINKGQLMGLFLPPVVFI